VDGEIMTSLVFRFFLAFSKYFALSEGFDSQEYDLAARSAGACGCAFAGREFLPAQPGEIGARFAMPCITQHHLPKTATEYKAYLAEKFTRIINSPQFANYEGLLNDYFRTPQESDEFPGWVLPVRNESVAVDDGANDCDESSATSAAGVPLRSEGVAALAFAMSADTLPPITNRGATLYRNESQFHEPPCTPTGVPHRKNADETPLDELPCPHIMGGYDGGVELGFDGKWPDKTFERVIAILEAGRNASQ
jgi:hypothetical protein